MPEPELIVVYDSECSFCARFAERVTKLDNQGKIKLLSSKQEISRDVAEKFDHSRLDNTIVAISADGRTFYESRAVAQVLQRLPGISKMIARLINLPVIGTPADWIYRLVSRYRALLSKFFGRFKAF